MGKFVEGIEFKTIQCADCSMAFAISASFMERRRDDHKSFYCPAGHSNYYPQKSDEEKLQDQLDKARRQLSEESVKRINADQQRRAAEQRYQRIKKRVVNGVCPCCDRTFENLMRHMRTKHPQFGKEKTLKALRTALGLTQFDLAEATGVSNTTISKFENGLTVGFTARAVLEGWLESHAK